MMKFKVNIMHIIITKVKNSEEYIIELFDGDILKTGDYVKIISRLRLPNTEIIGQIIYITNNGNLLIRTKIGNWWTYIDYIVCKIPNDEGALIELAENW